MLAIMLNAMKTVYGRKANRSADREFGGRVGPIFLLGRLLD
jgi:hypothetical protein